MMREGPESSVFGWDNFCVLEAWLSEHHRADAVQERGRIRKSLHRQGPSLARGLDLPGPPARSRFDFSAHRIAYESEGSKALHRAAAVASGATNQPSAEG